MFQNCRFAHHNVLLNRHFVLSLWCLDLLTLIATTFHHKIRSSIRCFQIHHLVVLEINLSFVTFLEDQPRDQVNKITNVEIIVGETNLMHLNECSGPEFSAQNLHQLNQLEVRTEILVLKARVTHESH